MNNFPFFRFSSNPYYNYYNYYSNINNNIKNSTSPSLGKSNKSNIKDSVDKNCTNLNTNYSNSNTSNNSNNKKSPKRNNFGLFSFNLDSLEDSEQPIIEILDIKLYLDDIIILCLLFLLYKEDSHDEGLFISLILLLLT